MTLGNTASDVPSERKEFSSKPALQVQDLAYIAAAVQGLIHLLDPPSKLNYIHGCLPKGAHREVRV